MKFQYLYKEGKIVSGDPNIWVKEVGASREGPEEFILHLGDARIGFSEPLDLRLRDKGDYVITVGVIGDSIGRWNRKERKRQILVEQYKFASIEEQTRVVDIIKQAMSALFIPHPRAPSITSVKVVFTEELKKQLENGVLINP